MVYRGKPSAACEACRARKTKCDANPDGCKQCRNAGRACPGYRSLIDLAFRDETSKLIERANAEEQRPRAIPSAGHSRRRIAERRRRRESDDVDYSRPVTTIAPSVDDRAKCFFTTNYNDGLFLANWPDDDESFLVDSLLGLGDQNPTLDASFKAISLMSFANRVRSPVLEGLAWRQYADAILLVNNAIASPDDVGRDETLLAVHLLGLFEVFGGMTKRSLVHWSNHCKGAAALLQLRGTEQFNTTAGCRLFRQARSSLIHACIHYHLQLPEHIKELSAAYARKMNLTGHRLVLFNSNLEICQMRHDVWHGVISEPRDVLARLRQLDEPLEGLVEDMSPEWSYTTVSDKDLDPETFFNGIYHVYGAGWVATSWNFMRSLRIHINQEIRELLDRSNQSSPLDFSPAEWTVQYERATVVCFEMQSDLIATCPQIYGLLDHGLAPDICTTRNAYHTVLAVWLVGSIPTATLAMRAYCGRLLRKVGLKFGIKHAFNLGVILLADSDRVKAAITF